METERGSVTPLVMSANDRMNQERYQQEYQLEEIPARYQLEEKYQLEYHCSLGKNRDHVFTNKSDRSLLKW